MLFLSIRPTVRAVWRRLGLPLAAIVISIGVDGVAYAVDPMASDNGLYPAAEDYKGPVRVASLDYPQEVLGKAWIPGGGVLAQGGGGLTLETAEAYALSVKRFLAPSFRGLIENSANWDPETNGWYDLVWSGAGSQKNGAIDPTSGREVISNTYSGQIMPPDTFPGEWRPVDPSNPNDPSKAPWIQNHAVIYYNDAAATMLGRVFGDVYKPDPRAVVFPTGSVVVKAEAVTLTPAEWKVLAGASSWQVFRPTTEAQHAAQNGSSDPLVPEVLTIHPLQMSIKIKDPLAAPETEWVFMGLVYDATVEADNVWDKFVPLGVMWGNDPELAGNPDGVGPGGVLQQTWINPDAPGFVKETLGWGDRLAGPMDVATRHNVLTPSGVRYQGANHLRASSCMSCHGAAEYPFTANLYPSPNQTFPPDGQPFLLYDPGSKDWQRWFQNRKGTVPMSPNIGSDAAGLDYDMAIMFAISAFDAAVGNDIYVQERFDVH